MPLREHMHATSGTHAAGWPPLFYNDMEIIFPDLASVAKS